MAEAHTGPLGHTGFCGQALMVAAKHAIAAGLTRTEYMNLVGFFWGQAASDHAHAVAAHAFEDAATAKTAKVRPHARLGDEAFLGWLRAMRDK